MSERWVRTTATSVRVLDLVEVAPRQGGIMNPRTGEFDDIRVELRTPDGEVFQSYSSVEKARALLARRGWARSLQVFDSTSTEGDPPTRAI